jgi:hypothetical protein
MYAGIIRSRRRRVQLLPRLCKNGGTRSLMLVTVVSAPCRPDRHCACGRCYSPGSVVGDWLRRRLGRLVRGIGRRLFGWRHRHAADGGLLVPQWVIEAFSTPER